MKLTYLALIATMTAVPAVAQDATGLRFGLTGNLERGAKNASGSERVLGGFAGYDMEMGGGVIGGELAFKKSDISVTGGGKLENTIQLKARYGKQIGNGLFYGTAGVQRAKFSSGGHDTGFLVGLGYEHDFGDKFFVGGEFTHNRFRKVGASNATVGANNLALRAGIKF